MRDSTLIERVYWATGYRLSIADAEAMERSINAATIDMESAIINVMQAFNRPDLDVMAANIRRLASEVPDR